MWIAASTVPPMVRRPFNKGQDLETGRGAFTETKRELAKLLHQQKKKKEWEGGVDTKGYKNIKEEGHTIGSGSKITSVKERRLQAKELPTRYCRDGLVHAALLKGVVMLAAAGRERAPTCQSVPG